MSQYACIPCADCDNNVLPDVGFGLCNAIDSFESEICEVFISNCDTNGDAVVKPADWTSATAWASVLGDTGTGKIRKLIGIGDMPKPTANIRTVSKGRKITGAKSYQIPFTIDDLTDVNYNAVRSWSCGGCVRIWFGLIGGKLLGGADGIKAEITESDPVFGRGEDVYAVAEMLFTWKAKCAPEMIDNPMA